MDIRNVAFDGCTGRIRFGSLAIGLIKIGKPKEERKSEKIRLIGDPVARIRTPGTWDVGDAEIELLSSTFAGTILPLLPLHGGSLIDFPITLVDRHPQVNGDYHTILDRCNFMGIEEAIENSEKANTVKLMYSCIEVFRKIGQGQWKSFAWRPSQGSLSAQALFT